MWCVYWILVLICFNTMQYNLLRFHGKIQWQPPNINGSTFQGTKLWKFVSCWRPIFARVLLPHSYVKVTKIGRHPNIPWKSQFSIGKQDLMIKLMIFSDRLWQSHWDFPARSSRSSGKGLCLGARICDTGLLRWSHWKGRWVRKHQRMRVSFLVINHN